MREFTFHAPEMLTAAQLILRRLRFSDPAAIFAEYHPGLLARNISPRQGLHRRSNRHPVLEVIGGRLAPGSLPLDRTQDGVAKSHRRHGAAQFDRRPGPPPAWEVHDRPHGEIPQEAIAPQRSRNPTVQSRGLLLDPFAPTVERFQRGDDDPAP
jgi:hypothetical protein